jgi:DNA-binding transcriptional regulator GbsR (MarR family)
MQLAPAQQRFVLHWGEMGTRWGVNRTVAQVHALLYLSPKPLNADDIVATLQVARSNVSTSLKELQGWGLARVTHVIDDKRDHFEAIKDVWAMFQAIADARKRRELDPTRALLKDMLNDSKSLDAYTRERIENMSEFFETTGTWYDQVSRWPRPLLQKLLRLGDKALKFMGG